MLPDADYVVLASRLDLARDAGFAVAVPSHVRLLEAGGARDPVMLSLDPGTPDDHAAQRQAYVDAGLLSSTAQMRNLFDDLVADSSWLEKAAQPGRATPGIPYREVRDAAGRAIASLPVIEGDPAWHLTDAAVVLHAADGDRIVPGFRGLYVAWLDHVAAERRDAAGDPERLFVVVCESRQTGELLTEWRDPRVRIVHLLHNSHLPAPYDDPSAPLEGMWARWIGVIDAFDVVAWPTAAQRDDIVARFGASDAFTVLPNTVEQVEPPEVPLDPHRVVMIGRLAPQKRVDRALRVWERVLAAVPDARLDIYGDGPLRAELVALADELGLGDSVRFRGYEIDRRVTLGGAALMLSTSAFEGHSIAVAEALVRGVPMVSFDVRYGPRDTVGEGGILVPQGDIDALADAVIRVLTDAELQARLARGAIAAGRQLAPDRVLEQFAAALRMAVERPSRRAR